MIQKRKKLQLKLTNFIERKSSNTQKTKKGYIHLAVVEKSIHLFHAEF